MMMPNPRLRQQGVIVSSYGIGRKIPLLVVDWVLPVVVSWLPRSSPMSKFQDKFYREHKNGCGKPC